MRGSVGISHFLFVELHVIFLRKLFHLDKSDDRNIHGHFEFSPKKGSAAFTKYELLVKNFNFSKIKWIGELFDLIIFLLLEKKILKF